MSNEHTQLESLRRENEELRRRVAELERRLEERTVSDQKSEPQREVVRDDGYPVPYEQIFDKLPMGASVVDANGISRALNRLFCEQLGVKREAAVGKYNTFEDPKAVEMGYKAIIERALRGEVVKMAPTAYDTAQSGMERLEDRQIWTQMTYIPVETHDGQRCVLGLNIDVTEQYIAGRKARDRERVLQAILDFSPLGIYAKDREGRYVFANHRLAEMFETPIERLEGKTDYDLLSKDLADRYTRLEHDVFTTGEPVEFEESVQVGDRVVAVFTAKFPLVDEQGSVYGICGATLDVSERRRAEEENRKLQEEMMQVQKAALRALSTPLIPIARGVVAMPLIGDIDQSRARQVLETLLRGVFDSRARIAILDVTGVTSTGPEVVNGLIQSARAVSMLGARVVLTGVQPGMAQRIASVSGGLEDIVTLSTLESGIAYAMRALRG